MVDFGNIITDLGIAFSPGYAFLTGISGAASGGTVGVVPQSGTNPVASSAYGIAILLIVIVIVIVILLLVAGYLQSGKLAFYKSSKAKEY